MYRLISFCAALLPLTLFIAPVLAQALSPERERALAAGSSFPECDACPEMVVVPAGSFTTGSQDSETGGNSWRAPSTSPPSWRPFALGRFEVTVDQFGTFVRDI